MLTIKTQLQTAADWQQRFRLLIQASRFLPEPNIEEKAQLTEISGCEARLWWGKNPQTPSGYQAFSEARIMNGILALLLNELSLIPKEEHPYFSLENFFQQLGILQHLSQTRRFGLKEIERYLQAQ